MYRFIIALICLFMAVPAIADIQARQTSEQDAKAWICYTVPLPKEIKILAEAGIPRGQVGLEISAPDKHPVYDEIRKEFEKTCGPASGEPAFRIHIEVLGADAAPFQKLKNASQAYMISCSADWRRPSDLTIHAATYRGAYYGWLTLQQLMKARSTTDRISIPLMTVTDWPDMEKRGLWGTDNNAHLEWLGQRKMNHMEQINARGMDEQGNYYAHSKGDNDPLDTDAQKYAIDYVPVLLHLEQVWQDDTMGKFHPEMKGKNATHPGALCYSEPQTVNMIAEWIYLLAKQVPNREVDVWMSENLAGKTGCQCDNCKKEHHTVNEARAIIKAWQMAEKKLGEKIQIYVLTSEATEAYNEKIFPELPPSFRVWYYHSLLSYNSMRQPMLKDYLGQAAKNGRWLGVCPNVDAWTHNNVPLSGAAFIKYRMSEFVNKGLGGLLGYATPRVHFNKFNVEAAAEWTWNLNGRSTKDFAYSYAVRNGYKDPEKFAEWSEAIGPVGWDVYGSNWPAGQKRGNGVKVKTALKDGTLPPLGYIRYGAYPTPWGNIANEKQLDDDVAASANAIKLAQDLGDRELMYETMVIDGYIRTMKALYELKKLAPKGGQFSDREKASQQVNQFMTAAKQVTEYLPKWESAVRLPSERDSDFTSRPREIMNEVAGNIKQTAISMGADVK